MTFNEQNNERNTKTFPVQPLMIGGPKAPTLSSLVGAPHCSLPGVGPRGCPIPQHCRASSNGGPGAGDSDHRGFNSTKAPTTTPQIRELLVDCTRSLDFCQ